MAAVTHYMKMSRVMVGASCLLLALNFYLQEFRYYGRSLYINYEAVGVLLPVAFVCLLVAFVCASWACYVPDERSCSKCLKILAIISCFIGGIVELAGVVVWRHSLEVHLDKNTNRKQYIPGTTKPLELQLWYSFPPTALMCSVFLAIISGILLIVDGCKTKPTTVPTNVVYNAGSPGVVLVQQPAYNQPQIVTQTVPAYTVQQ